MLSFAQTSRTRLAFASIAAAIVLALGGNVWMAAQAAKFQMTVYKSATCGCCSKWVEHMQANGFDVKALKIVIQRRAKDPDEFSNLQAIVDTYESELGTPVANNSTGARARAGATPEPKGTLIQPIISAADPGDIPDFLDRRKATATA